MNAVNLFLHFLSVSISVFPVIIFCVCLNERIGVV